MIFEQLLFRAKEGDLESITDILNMYRKLYPAEWTLIV